METQVEICVAPFTSEIYYLVATKHTHRWNVPPSPFLKLMLFNSSHLLVFWTHLGTTTKFWSSIQSTSVHIAYFSQHRFVCYSLSSLFVLHSFIEFLKIVAKSNKPSTLSICIHSLIFKLGTSFIFQCETSKISHYFIDCLRR